MSKMDLSGDVPGVESEQDARSLIDAGTGRIGVNVTGENGEPNSNLARTPLEPPGGPAEFTSQGESEQDELGSEVMPGPSDESNGHPAGNVLDNNGVTLPRLIAGGRKKGVLSKQGSLS